MVKTIKNGSNWAQIMKNVQNGHKSKRSQIKMVKTIKKRFKMVTNHQKRFDGTHRLFVATPHRSTVDLNPF